jgi:hypothetical protein
MVRQQKRPYQPTAHCANLAIVNRRIVFGSRYRFVTSSWPPLLAGVT